MKLVLIVVACMLPVAGVAAVQQTHSAKPATQAAVPSQTASVVAGANLVNPVKPTKESLATGKEHYGWDCAMCHGADGAGNGSLAKSEKMTVPNFTTPNAFKGMTDGQIFTIIRKGSAKMPPETKARANDKTVWDLVNYLRSLSKTPAS